MKFTMFSLLMMNMGGDCDGERDQGGDGTRRVPCMPCKTSQPPARVRREDELYPPTKKKIKKNDDIKKKCIP